VGNSRGFNENLHLWKGVMIKALQLSRVNNNLAMTCIQMLEKWFNALPVGVTAELYSDILPLLSEFLVIDDKQADKRKDGEVEDSVQEHYFF
jgi:hypothetical protein